MRNSIKAACAAGSTALILAAGASAQVIPELGVGTVADADRIQFGDLTLTTSDAACETAVNTSFGVASGATCNTLASDGTFIQRQIDVNGLTFIQTSISDTGFDSEDFVQIQFGSTAGGIEGIASKLSVSEGTGAADGAITDGETGFVATGVVMSGWAMDPLLAGDSYTDLTVQVGDAGTGDDGFYSHFEVQGTYDNATDVNTVISLVADQVVELNGSGSAGVDKQEFYTAIKAATTNTGVGDGDSMDETGFTITGGAGEVRFDAGDQIQVVWVGQRIDGLGRFGAQNLSNKEVGHLEYDPDNDPTTINNEPNITFISNLSNEGPFGWSGSTIETEFGAAPVF